MNFSQETQNEFSNGISQKNIVEIGSPIFKVVPKFNPSAPPTLSPTLRPPPLYGPPRKLEYRV
jgi:hypothetical protein